MVNFLSIHHFCDKPKSKFINALLTNQLDCFLSSEEFIQWSSVDKNKENRNVFLIENQ